MQRCLQPRQRSGPKRLFYPDFRIFLATLTFLEQWVSAWNTISLATCNFNCHCLGTATLLVFCFVPLTSPCHAHAGPSANGTAEPAPGSGVHASVDTSLAVGQRFVPPSPATTSGREPQGRQHTTAWAVRGGIKDLSGEFERLRPSMAHHFPFELDTFQKEAVVHLEKVDFSCTCTNTRVCKGDIFYLMLCSEFITSRLQSTWLSPPIHLKSSRPWKL